MSLSLRVLRVSVVSHLFEGLTDANPILRRRSNRHRLLSSHRNTRRPAAAGLRDVSGGSRRRRSVQPVDSVQRQPDRRGDSLARAPGSLRKAARPRAAGYAGPIYCTPATAEVARIVLTDAAKIQEENADYLNEHVRDPHASKIQPLYNHKDVNDVLKLFQARGIRTA